MPSEVHVAPVAACCVVGCAVRRGRRTVYRRGPGPRRVSGSVEGRWPPCRSRPERGCIPNGRRARARWSRSPLRIGTSRPPGAVPRAAVRGARGPFPSSTGRPMGRTRRAPSRARAPRRRAFRPTPGWTACVRSVWCGGTAFPRARSRGGGRRAGRAGGVRAAPDGRRGAGHGPQCARCPARLRAARPGRGRRSRGPETAVATGR